MTIEEMRRGAEITCQLDMTDEELALAIKTNALALAYIEGKGERWGLAITPLKYEKECLERYAFYRKTWRDN